MFYNHWKKIALSLTALFWAACEDSVSEAECLYGPPPEYQSSDASGTQSSSSVPSTSSGTEPKSSSSEFERVMPAYGVQMDCEVVSENDSTITCANGYSCKQTINTYMNPDYVGHPCLEPGSNQICPDYGVIYYHDVQYECSDGVTYDEYSFRKIYSRSSSSGDVTCTPTDSSVEYFAQDYSADTEKMWKEEAAKHDAVDKIDSIKQTLAETPMCLEQLRQQLDMFVALYGAPTIINNAVESCSDGTTRPSEEYARFLKMKEEWEANKPALEEELKKVYEDKMKEIEERINKCLNGEASEQS